MRLLALTIATLLATSAHAAGPDSHFEKVLKLLEPIDRLEQLCDYTAMVTIRKDQRKFHPDRAVASAIKPPKIAADRIEAKGGAFRSRKHWYEMSYSCTATPDHMKVLSFHLSVGEEIPETKWAAYGLWQ